MRHPAVPCSPADFPRHGSDAARGRDENQTGEEVGRSLTRFRKTITYLPTYLPSYLCLLACLLACLHVCLSACLATIHKRGAYVCRAAPPLRMYIQYAPGTYLCSRHGQPGHANTPFQALRSSSPRAPPHSPPDVIAHNSRGPWNFAVRRLPFSGCTDRHRNKIK